MARDLPALRRVLTLGGQAPLSVGSLLAAMVLATVAGTLWPALGAALLLRVPGPADLGEALELWRLATWAFYQGALPRSVLSLLFAGFMLLWLGRQLSYAWSERRFLVRFLVLAVGSGAVTLLLLLALGVPAQHAGAWPVLDGLLLTWALIFPHQRLSWFGAVEMSGATVARALAIGTPAWALVVGWAELGFLMALLDYLPHLSALALAWLLVAGGPRRAWHRLRRGLAERELTRQRRRFKVITTDRPPREWMN